MISNTSPLIAFSRIDRLDVLQAVESRILIPEAVLNELVAGARAGEPIIQALGAGWLEVRQITTSLLLEAISNEVDYGEAEAIVLALELKDTLLIDDRAARGIAKRLQIQYVGSLGIIDRAKQMGIIPAAKPLVKGFLQAGIHFHRQLIEDFFRAQGE